MGSFWFSKSKFVEAMWCNKAAWMSKYRPEDGKDVEDKTAINNGHLVGAKAQEYFGKCVDATKQSEDGKLDFSAMITKTKEYIASGEKYICEAAFSHDGLYCAVDILHNLGNNVVEIYEVKAANSMKNYYLWDTSYQRYVLTQEGYNVKKVYLMHLNKSYIRHGDLDLKQLFVLEDVTSEAIKNDKMVKDKLDEIQKCLASKTYPGICLCDNCAADDNHCRYYDFCINEAIKGIHPNVFDIIGVKFCTQLKWYKQGKISFKDLLTLTEMTPRRRPKQVIQINKYLNGDTTPYVDKDAIIKEFFSKITYPLYFLDFETMLPALPEYDDSHSYQQIPFQYSLHWYEYEGGELHHTEYLGTSGVDNRRELARQLVHDIPKDVCVLSYSSFESTRINDLAYLFDGEIKDHLLNIKGHLVDMMKPFQSFMYYKTEMGDSYSIKAVSPAMHPGDPDLDYSRLPGVHNGEEAMDIFPKIKDMDAKEAEETRKGLLKYCELDTYSMVKVFEGLKEAVK